MTEATATYNPAADVLSHYRRSGGWNEFAADVLGVTLDPDQKQILSAIQQKSRVSVRSGHARGKDYIAAVAAMCFLYLEAPCKVICTAPTDRQVINIMMAEITKLQLNAKYPMGGTPTVSTIRHAPDWFLIGFKASDTDHTSWTGFHSPRIFIIATEADGLNDNTWNAIEGLMTGGGAKQMLAFNPNQQKGYSYKSTSDPDFASFALNCLNAPNVIEKRIIYPGQVDYDWVAKQVRDHTTEIKNGDLYNPTDHDFEWEGKRYRPDDFFRVRVLGEYPKESENVLIHDAWIEAAFDRWREWFNAGEKRNGDPLMLGVDVAGMGRDNTVFAHRRDNIVERINKHNSPSNDARHHMIIAGKIKHELEVEDERYAEQCKETKRRFEPAWSPIDTIGEGAGVYSRLKEQGVNVISAKGSFSSEELTDVTGEYRFMNMRSYLWWAVRDALDPKLGIDLALPPSVELKQDLSGISWRLNSSGKVQVASKEEMLKTLPRSRDWGDGVRFTFWPKPRRPRAGLVG